MSAPAGKRDAKSLSSSGVAAANNRASRIRSSSARSACRLSPTITSISATFPIRLLPLLAIPRFHRGALCGAAVGVLFLAQIERQKRALLVCFHLTFAYQFQRRGETRRQHRGDHVGLHQIGDEISVEWTPIHG